MSILTFQAMKRKNEKMAMVTCYDYSSAKLIANTSVDMLLVGDSLAMTMYGYNDTIAATVEMMCAHTQAVRRGAGKKFIVTDLPFLSYRKSLDKSVEAVQSIMQSGANAIKLEGAIGNLQLVEHLVASGVPVMGHLGLTPQFIHQFGGYKVQGRDEVAAGMIKNHALQLQQAGCFSLVLECVPQKLAAEITSQLSIPVIGIGAGAATDGQVLVYQDLLGLNTDFYAKFVKKFANGADQVIAAMEAYVSAVRQGEFPQDEHCYNA